MTAPVLREQAVLDLLLADRDELGPGVPVAEVELVAATRWPMSLIGDLRREGWQIDDTNGRLRLYGEPESTRASDTGVPSAGPPRSDAPVGSDRQFPDSMWLGVARDKLRELAHGGHRCPCCGQNAKVYRRPLNAGIARALILLYRAGPGWVHKPTVLKGVGSAARDESIARFWGLIEEETARRPDGGRAGYWRVTSTGIDFVWGELRVPQYAVIYANELQRLEGRLVTVQDCLGDRFDYAELMGWREAA